MINGGDGCFFVTRFLIDLTRKASCFRSARILSACVLSEISIFLPFLEASFAENGLSSALNVASILQYSFGTNALISSSLSTIRRTATDCTRPADKPLLTFFHKKGLNLYPTSLSRILLACCALTRSRSILCGFAIPF